MTFKCSNCPEIIEYKFDDEYANNCNLRNKVTCEKCKSEYYIYIKIQLHKGKTPAPYAKKAVAKIKNKYTVKRIKK